MQKNKHPKLLKTQILSKDRSTFKTKWIFYKNKLKSNLSLYMWIQKLQSN